MPRLLFDVTQYVHWPATSGIQRVLGQLAETWQGDKVEGCFGFLEDEAYVVGPLADFATVVRTRFLKRDARGRHADDMRTSVAAELRKSAEAVVSPARLAGAFDAYFLPEPTYRTDSLAVLASVLRTRSSVPFALYYDALPLTHPHAFPRNADGDSAVTRYHRTVARMEHVAFISHNARSVFETRIARRRLPHALVVHPGADALSVRSYERPDPPRFVAIGTIEPRKRYPLVLEAFDQLWSDGRPYELVIFGAAGWERPEFFDRLARLSRIRPLRWVDNAGDYDVREALAHSTALLFVSDAEGYGLPPMEALSVGCPVIVSDDVPALEALPPDGQIRLKDLTPELLRAAIEVLADGVVNATYRTAIQGLELPTWQRFTSDIEDWVARRLRPEASPLAA